MTDDNCADCPIPEDEKNKKDEEYLLQELEELIRDLHKDGELISRKVVLAMRNRGIRPETVVAYIRELLVADLVIASHQRVAELHPANLQELERLLALMGTIGGANEALGVLLNERGLRLRNAVMAKMQNAEIITAPSLEVLRGGDKKKGGPAN